MRIISKNKDYYDAAKSLDTDQSLLYIRNSFEEKLNFSLGSKYYRPYFYINDIASYFYQNIIGFCGELHPFIKLTIRNCLTSYNKIFYNEKELEEFVFSFENKQKYIKENENILTSYKKAKVFENLKNNKRFNKYFKYKDKEIPIFSIIGSPTKEQSIIKYNCLLKDYEFYRVYDVYSAYLKLESYLNNIAVPLKPIPKISDEIMAEIKGFDKFSFRKRKSE